MMSTHSAQDEKEILAAVFRRRGANGRYTRLFDDLDENQKHELSVRVSVAPDEVPVIGSIEGPDQWMVLTTKRIVWSGHGDRHVLNVDEIVDAIVDLRALQESAKPKLQLGELQIKTKNRHHTIWIEPGAPLSGVWSVLKGIGVSNRRDVRTP